MNKPVYQFEIKLFHAYVELYINDLLVFAHYEDNGSIWVDWPINQYILESGIQDFEIRILPYRKNSNLSNNTLLEFGIHTLDESINSRKEIIEKSEIEIKDIEKRTFYIYKSTFNAKVSYKNIGWKDSIDLKNEDESNLVKEILGWNNKLLDLYKTSNIGLYNQVYKNRNIEFSNAYYKEYKKGTNDIFHSKFKELEALSEELYEIKFYGNNKLVSVKLPTELPGFTYDPSEKNENSLGISLLTFFHRKKEGEPLEIIR